MIRFSTTAGLDEPLPSEPPRRGLPLGWKLAIWTSTVVAVAMGVVTVAQEMHETRLERQRIEDVGTLDLVPLVPEIAAATGLPGIRAVLFRFCAANVEGGNLHHRIVLRDGQGDVVFSTATPGATLPGDEFQVAAIEVKSRYLAGGGGRLISYQRDPGSRVARRERWRRWVLHFGVTLVSIVIVLLLLIRALVTKPLERLLDGIRKMEMGYWGEVRDTRGAWEIRWIIWRFQNMGRELENTVQQLLEAERRAAAIPPRHETRTPNGPDGALPAQAKIPPDIPRTGNSESLEAACLDLEGADTSDPQAWELAHDAMRNLSIEAERLGDTDLKARLENAALRVLEPAAFRLLERRIGQHAESRKDWLRACGDQLKGALEDCMVPVRLFQYRTKHTAGVWLKMRAKGLSLEQIHDLYALRVVVPSEADCYWALRVVHDVFSPVVGRFKDYILKPKPNGYRSIHTSVRTADGQIIEVQIRSLAMHRDSENGAAAHVRYKMNGMATTDNCGSLHTW